MRSQPLFNLQRLVQERIVSELLQVTFYYLCRGIYRSFFFYRLNQQKIVEPRLKYCFRWIIQIPSSDMFYMYSVGPQSLLLVGLIHSRTYLALTRARKG